MRISETVIRRFAHLFIQLYGEEATAKARKMVEEMRCESNHESADAWLQIIEAMDGLGGAVKLAPDAGAPAESPIKRRLRRVYYGRLARAPIETE